LDKGDIYFGYPNLDDLGGLTHIFGALPGAGVSETTMTIIIEAR